MCVLKSKLVWLVIWKTFNFISKGSEEVFNLDPLPVRNNSEYSQAMSQSRQTFVENQPVTRQLDQPLQPTHQIPDDDDTGSVADADVNIYLYLNV